MSYNQQSGFGGFSFFPPMIKMLLLVNVGIFLTDSLVLELLSFRGMSLAGLLSEYFALQPLQSGLFYPWQLISYQFLHAGFSHIFFNLFALWMFGAELEQVMGSRRFIVFYLLSGIGGGISFRYAIITWNGRCAYSWSIRCNHGSSISVWIYFSR